jgi:spermidine/putrescine-binding protein
VADPQGVAWEHFHTLMDILDILLLSTPFTFTSDQPIVFLNWDGVADADLTDPFQIDPDATTDDTY